jgi:tyrosine-protein phosphatase YwqE
MQRKQQMIYNITSDSNSNTDSFPIMEEIKEHHKKKYFSSKGRKTMTNAKKSIMLREKSISPKYSFKYKKKLKNSSH